MANRARDWMNQALGGLNDAKSSVKSQDYEWTCFPSQPAAEKAVKAIFLYWNKEACGVFHQGESRKSHQSGR
jgi:HEPN domain-containing protein